MQRGWRPVCLVERFIAFCTHQRIARVGHKFSPQAPPKPRAPLGKARHGGDKCIRRHRPLQRKACLRPVPHRYRPAPRDQHVRLRARHTPALTLLSSVSTSFNPPRIAAHFCGRGEPVGDDDFSRWEEACHRRSTCLHIRMSPDFDVIGTYLMTTASTSA